MIQGIVERKSERRAIGDASAADPIVTELIRNSMNSISRQMGNVIYRTSVSTVVYETKDYASGLFDRNYRMLGNSSGIPLFLNTFHLAVQLGVEEMGGAENLTPGDVILYNWPYGSGTHPQDCTAFSPVFIPESGELIGYAVTKAHFIDLAGKAMYATDTTDVYQEGTIYPGVRIFKGGVRNDDVWRIFTRNSRLSKNVEGDLNALHSALAVGVKGLIALFNRFGREKYYDAIERMMDHGEQVIRHYFEKVPDGRYVGRNTLDRDGIGTTPVYFEVAVEVSGSDVIVDVTNCPDQLPGPFNSTLTGTESACRVAVMMLAGRGDDPNEGYFRPITVRTKIGTMFDAQPPAPCFLQGITGILLSEAVFEALSKAVPEEVPSGAAGDPGAVVYWGQREGTGEFWGDGAAHIHGQGASSTHDGIISACIPEGGMTQAPMEIWEERNPWLVEKYEIATDSCGAGKYRGGMGVDLHIRMLENAEFTTTITKTLTKGYTVAGGEAGRRNMVYVRYPDGKRIEMPQATSFKLPKDSVVEIQMGGGSGYGRSSERSAEALAQDLLGGYITPQYAKARYQA